MFGGGDGGLELGLEAEAAGEVPEDGDEAAVGGAVVGFEEGEGLAEAGGGLVVTAAFHGEGGGLVEVLGGFEGVGGGRGLSAEEELFGEDEVGLEIGEVTLGAEDFAVVIAG